MYHHTLAILIIGCLFASQTTAYGQEAEPQSPWDWSRLLDNPKLVRELEIVPDQLSKLRRAIATTENETRKLRSELNVKRYGDKANRVLTRAELEELSADKEAEKKWNQAQNDLFQQQRAVLQKRIGNVLLPHQVERLEQLAFWSELNSSGFARTIVSAPGNQLLKVDQEQAKRIEAKAAEYQREFAKQLFKLRQKYRAKLEQTLNTEQKRELTEILGDESPILSPSIRF